MRKEIRRVFVAAALALSITNAAAAPYTFSNLYDSSGPFNGFDVPYLNNSGTAAFGAALDTGGSGIFTGSGGATTTIVNASGPFADLRNYSLNNDGTVAFLAGNAGAFTGSGGPITTIFSGQGFDDFVISLSINDNGTVALLAELEREGFFTGGIFTGRGGPLTPLYEEIGGTSSGFGNFVPINDSGTVAFLVGLDAGGAGIFTSGGGPITTIVDTGGPFASFFTFFGGQAPGFSLNNTGMVAFLATLDTDEFGIFTGPDPLANEVISVGDPLFGSTVSEILMGEGSLNDAGEIAFFYQLADGRTGIALADPRVVPEPGTLALLGLGLAGLGITRRRRVN